MDSLEFLFTFFGSFLVALAVVTIDRWWTEKSEFLNSVNGLGDEIQNNIFRIDELENSLTQTISEYEKNKKKGGIMDITPFVLLQESFDYCRNKGILYKFSKEQRSKINYLYAYSDIITTLVKRDFQLSIFEEGELRFANKKRNWENILIQIEEYKKIHVEIKFYFSSV